MIFDLDGTLALIDHRKHFVECDRKDQDWDAFYKACEKDEPNWPIIEFYNYYSAVYGPDNVWIFSGRSSIVRM